MTAFARRVLAILGRIPPGRVVTYGEVAMAGRPGAARAVGNIMRQADAPACYHRVGVAGGCVGGRRRAGPQSRLSRKASSCGAPNPAFRQHRWPAAGVKARKAMRNRRPRCSFL
jgi:alkylated DNA nucleotide flippase Atl1